MIEVRIRHDYDAKSVRLCDWPSDQLDTIIPTIGGWGVYSDAGEYEARDLAGQFRLDGTAAYFEIVIETEPDA